MAIQIRRGNKADLQVANLLPGEQVLATDTGEVGIKSAGGDIIWYATLDSNGKIKQMPSAADVGAQPQTAARSAMIKADATGKLIAATEDTDYFAPHSTTVTIGSGWGSTLYLSRIGKIVVCVWVSTSNPYLDTVWVTLPATIPAGYRPITTFEQLRPLYDRTVDFLFGTDGSIKVSAKTAGNIPYFTPGAFCWVTA